jgi:hypothetical protein
MARKKSLTSQLYRLARMSNNLHRRHLTDSQRAMIAAKLATRLPGRRTASFESSDITTFIPPTRDEVAGLLNISGSAIQKAREVLKSGTPALIDLVASGKALGAAEGINRLLEGEA